MATNLKFFIGGSLIFLGGLCLFMSIFFLLFFRSGVQHLTEVYFILAIIMLPIGIIIQRQGTKQIIENEEMKRKLIESIKDQKIKELEIRLRKFEEKSKQQTDSSSQDKTQQVSES